MRGYIFVLLLPIVMASRFVCRVTVVGVSFTPTLSVGFRRSFVRTVRGPGSVFRL